MRMRKEVDSEGIIEAVKKHKAIWDLHSAGYHNKHLKEDAWYGVGHELYSDWETLPEKEQYVRQMELKKKWNHIRDYYKKLLAEQPGEEVLRAKKRRYLYSDILEFIRPVYDKSYSSETLTNTRDNLFVSANTNNSNDDSITSVQSVKNEQDTLEDIETLSLIVIPADEPSVPSPTPQPDRPKPVRPQQRRIIRSTPRIKRGRSPQLSIFERSIIKSFESKTAMPNDDDPDLAFLKSLLPDMKKLRDSEKFDFKLGIMELYKKISSKPNRKTNRKSNIAHDNDYNSKAKRLSIDEDSDASSS